MTTKQISQPVDEAEIKHHGTEGKRSDGYHEPAAQLIVPAARARQAAWARDDPDLASLRGDPRFTALVGER